MARYTIEGVEYPSVTEILGILDKPALKQWAVNMACDYIYQESIIYHDNNAGDYLAPKWIELFCNNAKYEWKNQSKEAMNIGSEVHNIIEQYIKSGRDAIGKMRPEVENAFLAFLEWEKENITEWLESEKSVCSTIYGYAGTLDAVAKLKTGEIIIIDFKSSKGFYSDYEFQIAAYWYAYLENSKYEINCTGILRLDKITGLPEFKKYDIDRMRQRSMAFNKLLDFYYAQKKRRLKNNPRVKEYWK